VFVLQAEMPPPAKANSSISIPSIVRQERRRAGIPKSRRQARVAPPAVYQEPGPLLMVVGEMGAVVVMVRVVVPAVVPEMLTGLVVKLRVGSCTAPVGLLVIVAMNCTLPVKPPLGVIVMVEVFPLVAPGARVTSEPPMLKSCGTNAVTVTVAVPDAGV